MMVCSIREVPGFGAILHLQRNVLQSLAESKESVYSLQFCEVAILAP